MNRAREGIIRAKELQKCKIIKKKNDEIILNYFMTNV